MLKKDDLKLGLILGFIAPFAGFAIYYLMRFRLFTVKEYLQVLMMEKSLLSGVISLSLLANAIIFTLYINSRKDKTATGIFIATCIYGVAALIFKWFG